MFYLNVFRLTTLLLLLKPSWPYDEASIAAPSELVSTPSKTQQLLIMTQGRSGSSWIGELVSKVPGALYLYEPCRSLALTKVDDHGKEGIHFGPVAEPTCQAMAARVLGCQITDHDANAMFHDFVAISMCNYAKVKELASKKVPFAERAAKYNKVCSQAPLRIVKEIRVNTVGPALQDREAFKVLHLVRDVRAVVHSRLRIDGFCLHHGAPGCAQPVCDGMAAARAGLEKAPLNNNRYRMVRYEDVCSRPLLEAQQLWSWLGWPLSPPAAAWVNTSTHKSDAPTRSGAYGTARADPIKVAHAWQSQLGQPAIIKISLMCSEVLKSYGYPVEVDILPAATAVPVPGKPSSNSTSTFASVVRKDGHHGVVAVGSLGESDSDHTTESTGSVVTKDGSTNEKKPWWKTHQKQAWKRNSKGKI